MKTSIKMIAATIALTAFIAGPAAAFVPSGSPAQLVHSVVGGDSNVFTTVQGDTVILSGYFGDGIDKSRALRALASLDGVERVIDNTTLSN